MNSQSQSATTDGREYETAAARERKVMLEKELERYLRILIEEGNPDLILIFGSMVTGDIHDSSDIDLVVVEESDLPFLPRTRDMRRMLKPQVGTDVLWYTPDEFNHMFHNRLFFKQEIVGKGKVLYERGDQTLDRLCQRRPARSRADH